VAKQTLSTLSLTQSSLFRPLVQPPFKRRCIPALYIHVATAAAAAIARWGVARCLPLSREHGLYFRLTVKVNGATSRGELPYRLTGTPNHNFNAYAYAHILYEYMCPNCRVVFIFEDENYQIRNMLSRFANSEIFHF